jgi:hypothetical protein
MELFINGKLFENLPSVTAINQFDLMYIMASPFVTFLIRALITWSGNPGPIITPGFHG